MEIDVNYKNYLLDKSSRIDQERCLTNISPGTENLAGSKNIYNSTFTKEVEELKKKVSAYQRKLSDNPIKSNIIPPYFNQLDNKPFYENSIQTFTELMTPITDNVDLKKFATNDFSDQFKLASLDNIGNAVASNDTWNTNSKIIMSDTFGNWSSIDNQDMTYNITDKKDFTFRNNEPFTNRRDIMIDQFNPNAFNQELANFTGVGLKPPKREVPKMFLPQEYKNDPIKNFTEYTDRYSMALSQRKTKEKPFESRQIGPGIGLSVDQDSLGGYHDTVRVLPRTTDEIRRNDLPKISYNQPVKSGLKSSKGPKFGQTYKHLPAFVKEYDFDQLQKNGGINKSSYVPPQYVVKNTSRKDSKSQQGPAKLNVSSYIKESFGKEKKPFKSQLVSFPKTVPGPSTNKKINTNQESYTNYESQRATSNCEAYGNISNSTNKSKHINFTDKAKITAKEDVVTKKFNNSLSSNTNKAPANFTDKAKITSKHEITTKKYNLGALSNKSAGYVLDNKTSAKTTIRQTTNEPFNTQFSPAASFPTSSFTDKANPTTRQQVNFGINSNDEYNRNLLGGLSGGHNTVTHYTDVSKITGKANSSEFIKNTILAGYKTTANNDQITNPTQRQNIGAFNIGSIDSGYKTTTNFTDIAQPTQILPEFNKGPISSKETGYVMNNEQIARPTQILSKYNEGPITSIEHGHVINNEQIARPTQKLKEYNMGAISNTDIGHVINNNQPARYTNRQTTDASFNTTITGNNKNITALSDIAKVTTRQDVNIKDYIPLMSTPVNKITNQYTDLAKNTNKQDLNPNFTSTAYNSSNQSGTVAYTDLAKKTIKEDTLILDHVNSIYNSSTNTVPTMISDIAKKTIKQSTLLENYQGSYDNQNTKKIVDRDNYNNMTQNTSREELAQGRYPTQVSKFEPDNSSNWNPQYKFYPSYGTEYITPQINHNKYSDRLEFAFKHNKKDLNSTIVFDPKIAELFSDVLNNNPLVNNIVHTGKDSIDYDPSIRFNFQKS